MATADTDFIVEFEGFNEGLSPLSHLDTKTFIGSKGQASEMKSDVISSPGFIQQSPALADLTNGNQSGVVDELIRFILDKPVEEGITFALGTSKLFRLTNDTVDSGSRLSSASSSVSPSISPSTSPSVSVSPSASPSTSPSVSQSPSASPSVSPSVSVSSSASPSLSKSASLSPSASPSTSPSVSVSPSISPSVSPSALPSWPQTITGMISGESLVRLKQNLYGFYNGGEDGDIFKMPLNTETIDNTWGSTTDLKLELAPHPAAVKEDIMIFGNGRYLGVYIEGSSILDTQKLDFGEGSEVADVVFHANVWWIAVNYGEGKRGQIYLYDGSAISNLLSDEAGIGDQKIGFLYVLNGIVYVSYDDNSSEGFSIGWLSGRQIKPLRYFSGTLPNHRQKALYKNTIIFVSEGDIWSCGAPVEQLPIQISKLADGGYSTIGGIASPFGTPLVASSDGSGNFRIAKFSGYSSDSNWKSIFVDITSGRLLGKVNTIIVNTKPLVGSARCDITLEGDQGAYTSSSFTVATANKTRHVFKAINLKAVPDIRLVLSFANGDGTNTCPVRKVSIMGNFVES